MTDTATVRKKLKGIGPILWINLDSEIERQDHMNSLLDSYNIEHTRKINGPEMALYLAEV